MTWARVVAGIVLMAVAGSAAAAPSVPTPAQALRLVDALLVPSPYKLPAPARAGRIRYRLAFGAGPLPVLPETGEQHVRVDAQGIEVEICADCGTERAPTAAELARYRAPNRWVQSDDRRIRVFAGRHDRGQGLERRMRSLSDAVRGRMTGKVDFSRYDSALDVLESGSGDCTEVALLLAAAARARGLPARVVYGVAYSSRFTGQTHVFSPHMWVQVWDGSRWRSFDAALERFDAGYIALAVGGGEFLTFAPATPIIARMRILAAASVAPPAASGPAPSVQR